MFTTGDKVLKGLASNEPDNVDQDLKSYTRSSTWVFYVQV